jgi:tetratricopeptide (TPR) repeat protein
MIHRSVLNRQLEQWNRQIQSHPNDAKAYIQRGMVYFKLAEIETSIHDFDQAERLNPTLTPYLWQRGLSYYYAGRFADGAKQFEIDLQVNAHDVEETVWRYLCMACDRSVSEAQTALLVVNHDPRPVMRSVYDLFAGTATPETVLAIGQHDGQRGLFYSHLYLGLFYEVAQESTLAQHYIIQAATHYRLDDYMWYLACVHVHLRGWDH